MNDLGNDEWARPGPVGSPREQLLRYAENAFRRTDPNAIATFPLPDERHLEDWRGYAARAESEGVAAVLFETLSQLSVPIRQGVSESTAYRKLTRQGEPFREEDFGGRLRLAKPEALELFIHDHPAGALPVLVTDDRDDFISLFRALACRSEPQEVSPSVNAQMIAGLNNWDRIERYRRRWERSHPLAPARAWRDEMKRVAAEAPGHFRDRLVIVFKSPYSAVSAATLGLAWTEAEWVERSMTLRVEHEFTHYATKRLFDTMRSNLHDELLADFMGMTRAAGRFSHEWFARFLGMSDWPDVPAGGRVHAYREELDDEALILAGHLVMDAAEKLEGIAMRFYEEERRDDFFLALTQLGLGELASSEAEYRFEHAFARFGGGLPTAAAATTRATATATAGAST